MFNKSADMLWTNCRQMLTAALLKKLQEYQNRAAAAANGIGPAIVPQLPAKVIAHLLPAAQPTSGHSAHHALDLLLGHTIGRAKRGLRKNWKLNGFRARCRWDKAAFFCRHLLEVHHYLLSLLAEKTGR
jgi:hypothetical protein